MEHEPITLFGLVWRILIGLLIVAGIGLYMWGSATSYNEAEAAKLQSLTQSMPAQKKKVEACFLLKERAKVTPVPGIVGTQDVERYRKEKPKCEKIRKEYEKDYKRLKYLLASVGDSQKNNFEKWTEGKSKPAETYKFMETYKPCFDFKSCPFEKRIPASN